MLQLSNKCRAGQFSVYPSNWNTSKADPKLMWRISYWFFDDSLAKKKKIVIKGMNRLASLKDKQESVRTLIMEEEGLLINQGWNHITKKSSIIHSGEINPQTGFIQAMDHAYSKIECDPQTKIDISSCLKYIKESIRSLCYDQLEISEIRKKHLRAIMEKCRESKKRWSNNLYNHYRKYLSILFAYLVEEDTIETNPVRDLPKKKVAISIRETLTKNEREKINKDLQANHYQFWLFLQIFFHSGSRIIELLRLKAKDIDIAGQQFKILVKKGKSIREEHRPIKDIALGYWQEAIANANREDYVFSVGLQPGNKMIRREQITRRWETHVKKVFKITADFYSLKHTNLDETAEALSLQDASSMAGHSTPIITMKHYTKGEKQRQKDRLRKVNNSFA